MARRELKITYGTYVAGAGQAKRLVSGPFSIAEQPDGFEFAFELVVADADGATRALAAADFKAELDAAIAAFRNPDQELRVELVDPDSVSTVEAVLLSGKTTSPVTATSITPEIGQPRFQEGQSGRSAVFEVVLRGERPADYDADSLRFDFEYEVSYTSARRRTLRASGQYTSTAATPSSLAQYQASIAAKVLAIVTGLGGDWQVKPSEEVLRVDKQDNVTRFSSTYVELFHKQSVGSLDDPQLCNQELVITAETFGAEDSDPNVFKLQRLVAAYRASVDGEVTKDLQSVWANKIEPWIRQNIRDAAATGTVAIMTRGPQFDEDANVITARVDALAATGGSLIGRRVVVSDTTDFGKIFRDYWPDDPNDDHASPDEAEVYRGAKAILREVETTTRVLGAQQADGLGNAAGGQQGVVFAGVVGPGRGALGIFNLGAEIEVNFHAPGAQGASPADGQRFSGAGINSGGHLIRRAARNEILYLGDPPDQFPVTDKVVTQSFRVVRGRPRAPGASGGGTSVPGEGGAVTHKSGERSA